MNLISSDVAEDMLFKLMGCKAESWLSRSGSRLTMRGLILSLIKLAVMELRRMSEDMMKPMGLKW